MSVINQMLNTLEQRGVQSGDEQVRPVRQVRTYRKIYAGLAVALCAVVAAGYKYDAFRVQVAPVAAMDQTHVATVNPVPENIPLAPILSPPAVTPALKVTPKNKPKAAHREKVALREIKRALPAAKKKSPAVIARAPQIQLTPVKQISIAQQADGEYRRGAALMQQGRSAEAKGAFEAALRLDAGLDSARAALVALLIQNNLGVEAEQALQDGLKNKPDNTGFTMLLARLQIQRNDLDQSIATLEVNLPHAEKQAAYQAFYAAMLQRKKRYQDAIEHYQIALKLIPGTGAWWMGYGICLQALSRQAEAKDAYQHALESNSLNAELQALVQKKLKGL